MLRVLSALGFLLLVGCGASSSAVVIPPPSPSTPSNSPQATAAVTATATGAARSSEEWRCFVMDPETPKLPQGNVTHSKERLVDGRRLEAQGVHTVRERTGATRIIFEKVGDHLEAPFGAGVLVVTLLSPDASHWMMRYSDSRGWTYTDETEIVPRGKIVRATDNSPNGPVVTVVRYLDAPCAVVDAELAKYPE